MVTRSQLFKCSPGWFRLQPGGSNPVPFSLRPWIFEEGSLTDRLRRHFGIGLHVAVLYQGWARPFWDEARALGLPAQRRALVREVVLRVGNQPLVEARTVIPAKTLRGVNRRLAHLGERPLGDVLFSNPRVRKIRLELTRVQAEQWRGRPGAPASPDSEVWGRRSLYAIGRDRLLVAEFFLPPLGSA